MRTLCYPVSRPVRTTEPTELQEPVTLAEAKHQCGVADGLTHHDEDLRRLITAAREQVENDTGLVCYTGTFTWKQTSFPCGSVWELPDIRPITAITSIGYVDNAGVSQTLSTDVYGLEADAVTPFVKLKHLQSWPTLRGDINGITVTMVAGFTSVLTVPQRVKQACLYLINHWFVSRDTVSIGTISPEISLTYESLIAGLRRGTYP